MNDYGNGKINSLKEILIYIQHEIDKIKSKQIIPNSNRQITNSGKLLAFNKIKSKVLSKIKKVEEHG